MDSQTGKANLNMRMGMCMKGIGKTGKLMGMAYFSITQAEDTKATGKMI